MRELRFLEQADDGVLIVAATDGDERFRLAVDAGMRASLQLSGQPSAQPSARPAPRPQPTPTASADAIGPRDIQVRVRAGERPEDLAEQYGAGLDWVLRFAAPVLAERERVADEARRARARRSTSDGQPVVFGEAVDARFGAHGIEPQTVQWDARRREDGQWVISAHWVGGDADRTAEWSFQLAGRTVAPIDDTAADLLSDRPIRPLVPVAPPEPVLSAVTAPYLAPGVVAFPAMADAHTGQIPRVEEVFDQAQFDDQPTVSLGAEGDDDPQPPAALFDEPERVEQALPLSIEGRAPSGRRRGRRNDLGSAARPTETDEQKAARAAIPSWDDILLGVRRKGD